MSFKTKILRSLLGGIILISWAAACNDHPEQKARQVFKSEISATCLDKLAINHRVDEAIATFRDCEIAGTDNIVANNDEFTTQNITYKN